jgi:hypothetical protein
MRSDDHKGSMSISMSKLFPSMIGVDINVGVLIEKIHCRRIATEESRPQNHSSIIATIESRNQKCGSRIMVEELHQHKHENKTVTTDLAAVESWQFGNHIRFAYWNCSNCFIVLYRS